MDGTVSIILRTRDRYIMLERAIDDIINQTYSNWKILLINDGGDIIKINNILDKKSDRIKNRIDIINLTNNKGLNIAINEGVKNVYTEFVVIHDDDDTWDNSFLEECVNYLNNNNCMGVITHTNVIYEKVDNDKIYIKKVKSYNHNLEGVISINQMLQNNQFPPISFLYRADVYNHIGIYNENLKVLEDWEFYIRFILKFDIHVIEKPLANYHIRKLEKNTTLANTITNRKKEHIKYSNMIKNNFIRNYIEDGNSTGLLIGIYSGQEDNGIKGFIKRIIYKVKGLR